MKNNKLFYTFINQFTKILLVFLYSSSLFAQGAVEPGLPGPDQDSTIFEIENDYLDFVDEHFSLCEAPIAIHHVTVLYANFASAEVRFAESIDSASVSIQRSDSLSSYVAYSMAGLNQVIRLPVLARNKIYRIYLPDKCDSLQLVAEISTYPAKEGPIGLSEEMFEALEAYRSQSSPATLNSYIRSLSGISDIEKLHFFQQFYWGGTPFPTPFDGGMPANEQFLERLGEVTDTTGMGHGPTDPLPCLCQLYFNKDIFMKPAKPIPGTRSYEPDIKENEGLWADKKMHGGWHEIRSTYGPSKYAHLATSGHKTYERQRSFGVSQDTTNGAPPASPLQASLRYNIICTNAEDLPNACHCERIVTASWRYDTRVEADARLGQTTVIQERKSFSKVEDWVVVTKARNNNINVLQSARLGAVAHCQATVNEAFILGILNLAEGIVKLITGQVDTSATGIIASSLGSLITGNFYKINECSSESYEATLAYGSDTMLVSAIGPAVRFDLFNFFHFNGGGRRNFKNGGRIHSSFYLTSFIPGGSTTAPSQDALPCCGPKYGRYTGASVPGASVELEDIHLEIRNEFNLYAPWHSVNGALVVGNNLTIDEHIGELRGSPIDTSNCNYYIINLVAPNAPFHAVEMAEVKVFHQGQTLVVESKTPWPEEPLRIGLYDLTGRLLHIRTIRAGGTEQVILPNLPSGVYIVQITHAGQRETIKVFQH